MKSPIFGIFRTSALRAGLIFAASIFALPLSAQITAGLLGQRYAELSVFGDNVRADGISNGTGLGVGANIPLAPGFDASIFGTTERISTYSFRENQLVGSITAFKDYNGVKPFAAATLGNTWQSSRVLGTRVTDNHAFYGLGIGVEAAVSDATAILLRADYNDYFSSGLSNYWLYTVGMSHWFHPNYYARGWVTFRDSDSVFYGFGMGMKF